MINFTVTSCLNRAISPPPSCLNDAPQCNRTIQIIFIITEVALISLSLYAIISMSSGIPITVKYALFSLTGIITLIDMVTVSRCVGHTHTSSFQNLSNFQNLTNQELVQQTRNLMRIEHKGIKPTGVLYKVKNASDETVGYLFGTLHVWDLHWESLRDEVYAKLNKSTDVYFEINLKTMPIAAVSVDLEIFNLAQGKNLHFLETLEEQMAVLNPYLQVAQANSDKLVSLQKTIHAWQAGDETQLATSLEQDYNAFTNISQEQTFHAVFADRNNKWFDHSLNKQLLSSSKSNKFFICVGIYHHLDVASDRKGLGLKTLIQEAGFALSKV